MKKYYVTMTDKFFSGWGRASGKIAKFVYLCESYDEAKIVASNARARTDQKNVNIRSTVPRYTSKGYLVQWKVKEDCPCWYQQGYFERQVREMGL